MIKHEVDLPEPVVAEPLMRFRTCIRRNNFPLRSAYVWKDQGLFPYFQIGRVILVRESEVLAALEKFRRTGPEIPHPLAGKKPTIPKSPGRPRGSKNRKEMQSLRSILDVVK
jgi:hypothetical protein